MKLKSEKLLIVLPNKLVNPEFEFSFSSLPEEETDKPESSTGEFAGEFIGVFWFSSALFSSFISVASSFFDEPPPEGLLPDGSGGFPVLSFVVIIVVKLYCFEVLQLSDWSQVVMLKKYVEFAIKLSNFLLCKIEYVKLLIFEVVEDVNP